MCPRIIHAIESEQFPDSVYRYLSAKRTFSDMTFRRRPHKNNVGESISMPICAQLSYEMPRAGMMNDNLIHVTGSEFLT